MSESGHSEGMLFKVKQQLHKPISYQTTPDTKMQDVFFKKWANRNQAGNVQKLNERDK